MWGVDLKLFQFDGSLTWAVFFLNGDKTIYGRYGTRAARDHMESISMKGFKAAMRGALALHKRHPVDKKALAGKTGPKMKWPTPELLPGHKGRFKKGDTSRMGCIHCHFVDEGIMKSAWLTGKKVEDRMFWRYPMPDLLGFGLMTDERATVEHVDPKSAADKAGLRKGDVIRTMEGQPILSIADVQWILEQAKDTGTLKLTLDRAGKSMDARIRLPKGWRTSEEFTWRGGTYGFRPGMAADAVKPADRKKNGIASDKLALRIGFMHPSWGEVAKRPWQTKKGLRKGDIIVALNGDSSHLTTSEFIARCWQRSRPGKPLLLTVLRGGKTLQIKVPTP